MSGVEILAVERVAIAFGFDWVTFILMGFAFALLFALIGFVIALACDFSDLGSGVLTVLGVLVGLALAAFMASASTYGPPTEFESHYKVTISDEVTMNDFLERYEIIDQDGKIFIVREVD